MHSSGTTEPAYDCVDWTHPNTYRNSDLRVSARDRDGFTFEFSRQTTREPLIWFLEDCTVTDRRATRIDFVCPGNVRPESLTGDPTTRPILTRAVGTFIGPTGIIMDHEVEFLENVCGDGGDGMCSDGRPEGCIMTFSTAHGTANLPEDEDE